VWVKYLGTGREGNGDVAVTFGLIDRLQAATLLRLVRGRVVHDLGCGDQVLAEALVGLGAESVVAVDSHPTGSPRSGVTTVRATFAEYAATEPTVDVAFVSWPFNQIDPPLLDLCARARTVAYLGKCTDGRICGWPGLFRHFLSRRLVTYAPHPANTLCVYGEPLPAPRAGELEERAGLDWQTVHRFDGRRS
jgi:hypothetical protein